MFSQPALKSRFILAEKITFIYLALTSIIILILKIDLRDTLHLLGTRLLVTIVIIFLAHIQQLTNWKSLFFVRYLFLGFLLSVWYPETYDINKFLENKDYLIAALEQNIFGFQPALLFHRLMPQNWFSEVMNLGYFAYYPIIIFTGLYFQFTSKENFRFYFFILLFSFYTFYIFYIIFPTVGPQYYYCAIGPEHVQNGIFPNLHNYFIQHSELNCQQNNSGFFVSLVEKTQMAGERPTAAFPSSHVGISTIILLILFEKRKFKTLVYISPIYLSLVAATVYIQAHYAIDILAGLISALILFSLGKYIYNKIQQKEIAKSRVL